MFSSDFEKNSILLSRSDLCGSPINIVHYSNSDVLYISYYYNYTFDCFQLA